MRTIAKMFDDKTLGYLDEHPVAGRQAETVTNTAQWTAWCTVFSLIALFMVVFSLMNFAELPLGWKDRTEQISRYLEATVGIGSEWALPTLWAAKGVEALMGVVALIGLIWRKVHWVAVSIIGWMTIMIGFAALDVWAADRAELQEHTLYFAAFAQMLMIVVVLGAVGHIRFSHSTRWGMVAWPAAPPPAPVPCGRHRGTANRGHQGY